MSLNFQVNVILILHQHRSVSVVDLLQGCWCNSQQYNVVRKS